MGTIRLIGENISYSASPAMQGAAFAALGLGHSYELVDVSAEDVPEAVAALRAEGVLGANVTVPHKAAVIPLLDEVEPLAARADAVNTIVNRGGRLIGSNTDVPAIADEIRRLRDVPRRAVVLGAGGAARGVAAALGESGGPEPVMVSRAQWSHLTAAARRSGSPR